jgi:hypothetical protein
LRGKDRRGDRCGDRCGDLRHLGSRRSERRDSRRSRRDATSRRRLRHRCFRCQRGSARPMSGGRRSRRSRDGGGARFRRLYCGLGPRGVALRHSLQIESTRRLWLLGT